MHFRDLTDLSDFRRVVELEKRVWGYTDAEDVVPVPVLVVTVKRGGILIGAFDDRDDMVGFVYSLPAVKNGRVTQWSHMLGVLEEFRGAGLGYALKIEQRQRALERGLDLIEWTFDPLQAVNANLNLHRLGAIVREYEENIYGDSSSPLHQGSPTDRFVAEWWICDSHVEHRLAAESDRRLVDGDARATTLDVQAAVPVNRIAPVGEWLECAGGDVAVSAPAVSVEIPVGFAEMQARNPELARAWRLATREIFSTYFGRGYAAMDFFLDRDRGSGKYILQSRDAFTRR